MFVANSSNQVGQQAGSLRQNCWDQVQDFNWHRAEKSPNWSVLPDQDSVSKEIWSKIVSSGESTLLKEILEVTGVSGLKQDG